MTSTNNNHNTNEHEQHKNNNSKTNDNVVVPTLPSPSLTLTTNNSILPTTTIIDNSSYLFERASNLRDGQFLACIVMKRKKDHPTTMKVPHEIIMHMNIDSLEEAQYKFIRAKAVCDILHARMYMRIDVRSYKRVAIESVKDIVEKFTNEEYKNCLRSVNHGTGVGRDSTCPRLFLLDVDRPYVAEEEEKLRKFVDSAPRDEKQQVVPTKVLRTVNGWHLICSPFNKKISRPESWMNEVDIKVDGDTLIYAG
jgi:hypothetical protein